MFVRFSCGCLGVIPGPKGEGLPFVVKPCDLSGERSWESIQVYQRDLTDKSYDPLPPEDVVELLEDIGGLVADGYRLRAVKDLLR